MEREARGAAEELNAKLRPPDLGDPMEYEVFHRNIVETWRGPTPSDGEIEEMYRAYLERWEEARREREKNPLEAWIAYTLVEQSLRKAMSDLPFVPHGAAGE